jgi:hypothetical protein
MDVTEQPTLASNPRTTAAWLAETGSRCGAGKGQRDDATKR